MNKFIFKTAIYIGWITLIVCLIIKLFGGNWFEFPQNVKLLNFVESNIYAYTAFCTLVNYILFTFYYLAICERRNFKWWVHIVFVFYFLGLNIAKNHIDPKYYIYFDLITSFIVPLILVFMTNKKYLRIIVAYVLDFGFQSISLTIRNMALTPIPAQGLVFEFLLSFDVVIMLVLYYLYSLYENIKKKEVENNE